MRNLISLKSVQTLAVLALLVLSSWQVASAMDCVDTFPVGDGWGWDGSNSCVVSNASTTACIDSPPLGDGWGWNGSSSCVVNAGGAEECIDSPPLGDGWGWNGSSSCVVGGGVASGATECIDSPPVGDGWGWDGTSTCVVTASTSGGLNLGSSPGACVDTNPVGDGWGWNGISSCQISGGENTAVATVKIMPTGDSITHGTLGQRSYRFPLIGLLSNRGCDFEMVGSQIENEDVTDFRSGHEGYSHQRAQHFLNGFGSNEGIRDSMNRFDPNVVLLHIGSNDVAQGEGVSSTVSEIESIISIVFQINPEAQLFLANVIPWYSGTRNNQNVLADTRTLGTQLRSLVNRLGNSRVHFVDVQTGYSESMMLPDGVHPNDSGEALIASAFAREMSNAGVCR